MAGRALNPRSRSMAHQIRRDRQSTRMIHSQTDPSPDKLAEMYEHLAAELTDFSSLWPTLAPMIGKDLAANVLTEGRNLGETWQRLSKGYLDRKVRAGFPRRMLIRSKALVESLGRGQTMSQSPGHLSVGIPGGPDAYGHDVHYGWRRRGEHWLPPRKFMAFSKRMISTAQEMMFQRVRTLLEGTGQRLNRGWT